MYPSKIIVRFEQVAEQDEGPVRRIVGFVKAKNILQVFDAADLEANPRSAKSGNVTEDIIDSIRETPELFPHKTKGVLMGAAHYEALQRHRYELRFENSKTEGILDGGHNMLAIGTYILMKAVGDSVRKKIKRWPDLKDIWVAERDAIETLRRQSSDGEETRDGPLDFLIPLEILVPSNVDDDEIMSSFTSSLLSICSARNNNVEPTSETKAQKKGYHAVLQKALPKKIKDRIEWKTNDGGEIKVRDLIALAWIPLSVIDLPKEIEPPRPQNIYRNKGECSKLFDELMDSDDVCRDTEGNYTRELHNNRVRSALQLAGELPTLYDRIYRVFPDTYNDSGGRFGGIGVVKLAKDMHTTPTTHFTDEPVEYSYPDGLIMPLVYGLRSLMTTDADGCVDWKEDPKAFLDAHLEGIIRKYRVILDAYHFDPQKVGKNEGSYDLVVDAFETEMLKRARAN